MNNSMNKKTNVNVMVYIDNSNVFIQTQKYSAKKKKFLQGILDLNCRVDVGKLVVEATNNRNAIVKKLYGSTPPPSDSVWKAIRKKEIEVKIENYNLIVL